MNKENKIAIILVISATIITIIGSTLAYWSWQTNSAQQTAVTFTVQSGFSCSADGGGNITSNDKMLAPAACTNNTYAIKRTVTVSPTINQANKEIYLDLWLKVKNIGAGLAASQNMKYALTTDGTSCTSGTVVAQGNFNGATTNTQKTLLHEKAYSATTTETYYLWIWLDATETDSATQNQTFSIELGGICTDEEPNYVYTVNIYDRSNAENTTVTIGQAIPDGITQYTTPEDAMTALNNNPFYLKHKIQNGIVTESYCGFVVSSAMAQANNGMTAGTYYIKGSNDGVAYSDNRNTLVKAFTSANCGEENGKSGEIHYNCVASSVPELFASTDSLGSTSIRNQVDTDCYIKTNGTSYCSQR